MVAVSDRGWILSAATVFEGAMFVLMGRVRLSRAPVAVLLVACVIGAKLLLAAVSKGCEVERVWLDFGRSHSSFGGGGGGGGDIDRSWGERESSCDF